MVGGIASLVSVIVPVYNVEPFLDECIQSLVDQTFRDIEIILINDGSTDASAEICAKWAGMDDRIRFVDKKNEGQGICRNLGVSLAQGEWVTFVDSDDWVDATMIAQLFSAAVKYDADIAMCEAYTQNSGGKFSGRSLQQFDRPVIDIQKEKEFLLTVRYTLWSKLYRKSLFIDHDIIQPSIKFEDFAVVPLIYALAQRVACVDARLYFYRYRPSSTVRDALYIGDRLAALTILIENFKKNGLFNPWHEVLKRLLIERGLILMRQIYPILNKSFQSYCAEYDQLLKTHFGLGLPQLNSKLKKQAQGGDFSISVLGDYDLAVFGSYNLMIVAKIIMNLNMPDFLENHFCFSGLISAMSHADERFYGIDLSHKSAFRQKHLLQDFTKSLRHKNICEFRQADFFLVDFLEERFDTARCGEGYFTISDAFLDISEQTSLEYETLSKFSPETKALWKESCLKFIRLLKRYIVPERVILVRSLLAENYGEADGIKEYFPQLEQIRKTNALLNEYYDFFIENMPEAMVAETDDMHLFTEKDFRHGCVPWHLGETSYWLLHMRVLERIKSVGGADIDLRIRQNYLQTAAKMEEAIALTRGRKIAVWYHCQYDYTMLNSLIRKTLDTLVKTPHILVASDEARRSEFHGCLIAKPDIFEQMHQKPYFVVIGSGPHAPNAVYTLEAIGYTKGVDFLLEEELDSFLTKE